MSDSEKCSVSRWCVVSVYALAVILVMIVCLLGTIGANALQGMMSEVNYAPVAGMLGLGMGLICGVLWCVLMREGLQRIPGMSRSNWREWYFRRGVLLATLAGFLATIAVHAVLGWAYNQPSQYSLQELGSAFLYILVLGSVFGLPSGLVLGLITTSIWRSVFGPQVLIQTTDKEADTTPPKVTFSNRTLTTFLIVFIGLGIVSFLTLNL